MTKIKICGIMNYEDGNNAVDLGADFLGFNFYSKSPRYINYKDAGNILMKISGAKIVGVFVNEKIEKINKISDSCNLDLIQLSGDEDPDFVDEMKKSTNKKIIKSFRIRNKIDSDFINSFNSDYIMLDSFKDGLYGGTGESFDLNAVKGIDNKKLFLAGGLNNKNVKFAIQKINPYAVDVCSSIEKSPGKKDFNKMKRFIEAVR